MYKRQSLIIGYAPCEMHGVKGGMTNCQNEMKRAVEAGYWNMFRFDPRKTAEGKNPFTIDSLSLIHILQRPHPAGRCGGHPIRRPGGRPRYARDAQSHQLSLIHI